jgi:hypothetical protein
VSPPAYLGAFQASFFDGKSDGKNLFGILFPKFTVRIVSGRRERLQIAAYARWESAWLGEF